MSDSRASGGSPGGGVGVGLFDGVGCCVGLGECVAVGDCVALGDCVVGCGVPLAEVAAGVVGGRVAVGDGGAVADDEPAEPGVVETDPGLVVVVLAAAPDVGSAGGVADADDAPDAEARGLRPQAARNAAAAAPPIVASTRRREGSEVVTSARGRPVRGARRRSDPSRPAGCPAAAGRSPAR